MEYWLFVDEKEWFPYDSKEAEQVSSGSAVVSSVNLFQVSFIICIWLSLTAIIWECHMEWLDIEMIVKDKLLCLN